MAPLGNVMKVDGGCFCGAITYEAEVEPGTVVVCHCLDCQRLSGTAFRAGIAAPAETFRFLSGTPRQFVKTADSGARRRHAFCGDCGSPVYSCAEVNPRNYTLRLGALRQAAELGRPARQIWTRRRHHWLPDIEDIPEVAGQP
jgi:hypothetical protein